MTPVTRFLLSLLAGIASAMLLAAARVPLPWFLGPLLTGMIATAGRWPVHVPLPVGRIMVVPLGIFLGSQFSWMSLRVLAQDSVLLLAGLLLALMSAAWVSFLTYRALGHDFATAYYCSMPGGVAEMTLLGEACGADARSVSISHTGRILLVVTSLSLVVPLLPGAAPAIYRQSLAVQNQLGTAALDMVFLGVIGIMGVCLGRLLRLGAAYLIGPMIVSAVWGFVRDTPVLLPSGLIECSQLIVALAIASRLRASNQSSVLSVLAQALMATVAALAVVATIAGCVAVASGSSFRSVLLAYAPGGLTETSLIAVGLHVDVNLIATAHLLRIFIVTLGAGSLYRWLSTRGH